MGHLSGRRHDRVPGWFSASASSVLLRLFLHPGEPGVAVGELVQMGKRDLPGHSGMPPYLRMFTARAATRRDGDCECH